MIVDAIFVVDVIDDVDVAVKKALEFEAECFPLPPSMTVLELYISVEKVLVSERRCSYPRPRPSSATSRHLPPTDTFEPSLASLSKRTVRSDTGCAC